MSRKCERSDRIAYKDWTTLATTCLDERDLVVFGQKLGRYCHHTAPTVIERSGLLEFCYETPKKIAEDIVKAAIKDAILAVIAAAGATKGLSFSAALPIAQGAFCLSVAARLSDLAIGDIKAEVRWVDETEKRVQT